jgi:uncharacterized protein
MTWNVIPLSAAPASPWRNGGGVTRELAAGPARDDWAWRISVAEVAADGPFSHFPGVQRWFAVVRGNGVRLAVDGKVHEVVASSEPLEFDGGAQVDSWLLAGATQDLNLMVRRERASARMMRLSGPQRVATVTESVVAVYALDAATSVRGPEGSKLAELPPQCLGWALLPGGTELDVVTSGAICMQITPHR